MPMLYYNELEYKYNDDLHQITETNRCIVTFNQNIKIKKDKFGNKRLKIISMRQTLILI